MENNPNVPNHQPVHNHVFLIIFSSLDTRCSWFQHVSTSSVHHPVTVLQAVSLRRLLDGGVITIRSLLDAFLDEKGIPICQRGATFHNIPSNLRHKRRNSQTCQRFAVTKSTISNLSHRLWDNQTPQRAAASEGNIANSSHRLWDGQTGQFHTDVPCHGTSQFSMQ